MTAAVGSVSRHRAIAAAVSRLIGGLALLLAGCTSSGAGSSAAPAPVTASATVMTAEQLAYVSVIQRVLPSVVEIRTDKGLGSGVVFDDAGHIVTNNHVVAGARSFQVVPANSAGGVPARLLASYPPDDLAVLQVAGRTGLRPATFADSAEVQVGDLTLAMGNSVRSSPVARRRSAARKRIGHWHSSRRSDSL